MKLEKTISNISKNIVERLESKGLVSLYLVGTILTKDRVYNSDIDFFGFVTKDFNIAKEEDKINDFFDRNKKGLCNGMECRFRAVGLDEIRGKNRGRIAKFFGMGGMVLAFPYWKLVFGEDVKLDEKVKPYSVRFRKGKCIRKLEFMIGKIRSGENYFLRHLAKEVLRLAGVESEMIQGKGYEYFYSEIEKMFSGNKKHIVHKAMRFRRKKLKEKEMLDFIPEVEEYVEGMRG